MTANKVNRIAATVIVAAAILAGCAMAQEAREESPSTGEPTILTPDELAWQEGPPSLPPGTRVAVLSGDPATDQPFTMRVELPPNVRIAPHTHHGAEHVTVLSGSASVGLGDTLDAANATPLSAGAFLMMPPGTEHYFLTGDQPVVLQLHGHGPWGIAYLNPEDDPQNA